LCCIFANCRIRLPLAVMVDTAVETSTAAAKVVALGEVRVKEVALGVAITSTRASGKLHQRPKLLFRPARLRPAHLRTPRPRPRL
jgi:hypothetical protein